MILDSYLSLLKEQAKLDITLDTVTVVDWRILVGAGPRGTYSVILQHYILGFWEESSNLWVVVVLFPKWLKNQQSPWQVY